MKEFWTRIEQRIKELDCWNEMALQSGASESDLSDLERHLGVALPNSVREFLAVHNGQEGFGLIFGQEFLSTSRMRQEWDNWRSIDETEMNDNCSEFMESNPEGVIKPMYCNRAWIPLTHDGGGNHIGIDFDPDSRGKVGQVIAFGRDEDTKRLLAGSFEEFLESFESWLAKAKWNGEYLEESSDI
jgi:cell wall assembly regulator SMI1